jgi:hypothetical protein
MKKFKINLNIHFLEPQLKCVDWDGLAILQEWMAKEQQRSYRRRENKRNA